MSDEWLRGNQVVRESLDIAKTGQIAQALCPVDSDLEEATQENRSPWVRALYNHAAILALASGDRRRQIQYTERGLSFSDDYAFAAYNLAKLLQRDGQFVLAEHNAKEAYKRSFVGTTQAERDLVDAIERSGGGQ